MLRNMDIVTVIAMLFSTWTFIHPLQAQDRSNPTTGAKVQYRAGDIIIGGLMVVHQMGSDKTCSELDEIGVQSIETMNLVLDQVNANDSILPGVQLGSIMVDTCNDDTYALQQVVVEMLPHFSDLTELSDESNSTENGKHVFAGVVGAAYSSVSIQIAKLLRVFRVPQVSFLSTDPKLSDKNIYEYFFRTVPSDVHQVKAIVTLIQDMNWKYVSVVYEDTDYGRQGFRGIRSAVVGTGICLAAEEILPTEGDAGYDTVVEKLLENKAAKVVVLFTIVIRAEKLIKAVQTKTESSEQFLWIASDGWAGILLPDEGGEFENALDGSIGFTHDFNHIPGFDAYISNITLSDNTTSQRNPWIAEYISERNNCSLKSGNAEGTKRICEGNEHISDSNFHQLDLLQSVADATLSFVYALDKYHRKYCGGKTGTCPEISSLAGTNKLAERVYGFLGNTSFTGVNGNHFEFDKNQDGPAKYRIVQYRKSVSSQVGHGKWVKIGVYNGTGLHWTSGPDVTAINTVSVCSEPCGQRQKTIILSSACCWDCEDCEDDEYVAPNGTSCPKCQRGQIPTKEGNGCIPLQIQNVAYNSPHGIACLILSGVGLLLTIVVITTYVKYIDTPVIKASGAELSFVVLLGAILTLFNSLAVVAYPTNSSCAVARFILGVGPTLMYAGLLTKTMRVVIIFRSKLLSPQMKLFLRPCSQILVTSLIVLVQVFVVVVWLISVPPDAYVIYFEEGDPFRTCRNLTDITILVGLIFPFILILICTILATVNRHVPAGFRETMLIGFTMYTTCVIWLAFFPIFLTNSDHYLVKLTTISVCLSLSAFTTLFCLFLPYCYKIIFKSHENTSQSVMSGSRHSRSERSGPA